MIMESRFDWSDDMIGQDLGVTSIDADCPDCFQAWADIPRTLTPARWAEAHIRATGHAVYVQTSITTRLTQS